MRAREIKKELDQLKKSKPDRGVIYIRPSMDVVDFLKRTAIVHKVSVNKLCEHILRKYMES